MYSRVKFTSWPFLANTLGERRKVKASVCVCVCIKLSFLALRLRAIVEFKEHFMAQGMTI